MHGAGARVGTIPPSAHPFEIGCDFTVKRDVNGIARKVVNLAALLDAKDGARERLGRDQPQSPVDVDQVVAIKLIEFRAIVGTVLRAIPPVPVAAFSDQKFIIGEFTCALGDALRFVVSAPCGIKVLKRSAAPSTPA